MAQPAASPTRRLRRRAGALAATLALAAGAALAAAPAAVATFPGADGKIAFARDGDIWTINPDGTGERRVTSGPHVDVSPDWSPDGKELAFERLSLPPAAPSSHVYRVRADGTGLTWVMANGHEPGWFRDGKRIAFTRDGVDGRDLFIANRDGSGQRMIRKGLPSLHAPDPSPVSDFVLATSVGLNLDSELVASSPGTGRMSWELTDPDNYDSHAGTWSPDGRRIAFYQGTGPLYSGEGPDPKIGLAVMDVDGTNIRVLTHGIGGVFSPAGSRIAYNAGSELRGIKTDGTGMRTLAAVGGDPDWQRR